MTSDPDQPSTLAIGRVVLTVHDLDAVGSFYQRVVGLRALGGAGDTRLLGAGERVLLELRRDPAARRRSPHEAGLFHTAFLLPGRDDLGRWVRFAAGLGVRLEGASDHLVSEALYLSDPEGNGIEIYADRPPAAWRWRDGLVEMATARLDLDDLVASGGDQAWRGVPDAATVGHVHLQVGALPAAEAFYAGLLGLDVTCRYPGAVFYSADGYHHHLATNVWNSRGAPVRDQPATGLAELAVELAPARLASARQRAAGAGTGLAAGSQLRLDDPWGTRIVLTLAGRPDAE